jgi:hypothetical protein
MPNNAYTAAWVKTRKYMNKRQIIIVSLAVIVALGGVYEITREGNSPFAIIPMVQPQATSTSGTPNSGSTGTSNNLRKVVTQGGNYTCSVFSLIPTGKATGTIFSAGGKTRLDFSLDKADGSALTTHIIRTQSISYTWVDGQNVGTKSTVTPSSPIIAQPQGGVSTSFTDATNLSSECHPWFPDAKQFTPPMTITFIAK